ncbi:class I SAM-dependent methyltransferase [Anabaena sp. UHCC 0204]|uniref:class I SAM-dependent methyltransferase n=1 Tax=Anabaena sp. UHCC 0204 TaxID=2590009 RepID=UPI00144524C6|nr:class I SAM-dependent methyltransferase [Anabaena sp. UHCC 0204]MTJ08565.1 class I SAM-dependent methyltransferase [Anabaena sp. UHCC 0204]
MSDIFTKLSYQTFQQGKNYFGFAHKTLSTQIRNLLYPSLQPDVAPLSKELITQLQDRLNQLWETDWQDAQTGVYPQNLLFDNPWEDFFRYYPLVWLDLPNIWERIKNRRYQDFSQEIATDIYPNYYLQNFHYQTDGYLSELSANLYDLQVEILFGGSTDAMRRRILSPLKSQLAAFDHIPQGQLRVIDVACGTGRTLKLIRAALPQVSLFGIDLSPAYLQKANELLLQIPGELPQLIQGNAEELPYRDDYFHAMTCVFLFHELPAPVRQTVMEECFRVTKPGGILIICDSIQVNDAPEMELAVNNFSQTFHEPYYQHYSTDDLVERLEKAGFERIETQVHFLSKYLVAHKPSY